MTALPATSFPRETGRQIAALERLLEVARQLGASVELDPLLEVIATAATTVLDCERATVFLYDTRTEELYSRVATGIEDSAMTEIRFPASRGIAGEVARTGNVITLAVVDGGRKRRRGDRVAAVQNGGAQPCSSLRGDDRGESPDHTPFQREAQECTATWRSGARYAVRC